MLTALIGASGAGKTTLMDVLADRKTGAAPSFLPATHDSQCLLPISLACYCFQEEPDLLSGMVRHCHWRRALLCGCNSAMDLLLLHLRMHSSRLLKACVTTLFMCVYIYDAEAMHMAVGGRIEGEQRLNGRPKEKASLARVMGYVEQDDIHTPALTVYESLRFSAHLRLNRDVNTRSEKAFVDDVSQQISHLTALSLAPSNSSSADRLKSRSAVICSRLAEALPHF